MAMSAPIKLITTSSSMSVKALHNAHRLPATFPSPFQSAGFCG
jgi:hypothetical protein